jgi:hypothetical protein
MGWLRPWLRAFLLTRRLQAPVLGPVDFSAFSLLACRRARLIQHLLLAMGRLINSQPLLGELALWDPCLSLEPLAVSYILRQIQTNISLPRNKKPRQWTGHLFRVGAAVDLVESGYTIEQVMRKSDWKSLQLGLRYVMAE